MNIVDRINQIERALNMDFRNQPTRIEVMARVAICDEYPELNGMSLKKAFSVSHSIAMNYRRGIKKYKGTERYEMVLMAIKHLDPSFLPEPINKHYVRKKAFSELKPKLKPIQQKIPTEQVMLVLRKNRKCPLWLKEIRNWGNAEWGLFETLKSA